MFINWKLGEINLKIVYYGPGMSGKTTNLEYIHAKTKPEMRGDLVSLKTKEDRTIFFDFLQLELGKIRGLKPKFNLYTVPGQVIYASSRKLVLRGADGLVFVADSQIHRLKANRASLRSMGEHLIELGFDPREVPLVIQFNKRDLPNVAPVPVLRRSLGVNGLVCFESVATQGVGVFDTLKATINAVMAQVQGRL